MKCRALSPEGHIIWFGKTMDTPNAAYYQVGSDAGYTEPISAGWSTFNGDLSYATQDTDTGGRLYIFKKGAVIKIGKETYRILKVQNKIITLMGLKTYTTYKPFSTQRFTNSTLYQYLNNDVYNAFPAAIKLAIQYSECKQELWSISDTASYGNNTFKFEGRPNPYYLIHTGSISGVARVRIKLCSIQNIIEYFDAAPYTASAVTKLTLKNLTDFFSGETWLLDSVDSSNAMAWFSEKIQAQSYSATSPTHPSKIVFDLNLAALKTEAIGTADFEPADVGQYNNTNYPAAQNYISDTDAVVASLNQRLSVIKGELWYQVNYGLPLTEKQRGTTVLDLVISDIITSHPGVASLDSYTSKVSGHTYYYDCKITSVFGDSVTVSNNLTV